MILSALGKFDGQFATSKFLPYTERSPAVSFLGEACRLTATRLL
ncbi:hypothetical protein ABF638_30720 [Nostoc sp. CALU 1950]|nr:hypothetical protein [Nostoc edaphicum]